MNGNLDYHLSDEFLEAQAQQRAFSSSFFRRMVPNYQTQLGPDAAKNFTRWWTSNCPFIGVASSTQREFDGAAHDACNFWLTRWTQRKMKQVLAGEPEAPPTENDEVSKIRASWGVTKNQVLRIPPSIPERGWRPCKHWSAYGEECENCKAEIEIDEHAKRAGRLYDQYRPFVRKRLHAELLPYTKQIGQHPQFDDIESLVWEKVTTSIGSAQVETPFAWLRTVVASVVLDYFDGAYRKKRDVRKTQTLGDMPDKALDQMRVVDERGNICLPQEKPVGPKGHGPNEETEARAYLSTLKAKSASKLGRF
ncbi:MAG: hypothetical protein WA182_13895 [Candidatus Sulfotelmatobacter sp.]